MTIGRPRKFASTTPVLIRVPDEQLEELDAWVEEVRETAIGTSTVSRSDLIRDILRRAIDERRALRAASATKAVNAPHRGAHSNASKNASPAKGKPKR